MEWLRALFGGSTQGLPDRDSALAHRLVEDEDALLIDVRSPAEFASGHIDGAINLPVDSFPGALETVGAKAKPDHPIVVYCASGMRSGRAKKILTGAGYGAVTNLGSIRNW